MNGTDCQGNVLILEQGCSVNMFKNKIGNYFKIWVCLDVGYEYNRTLDKPVASLSCAILGSQHNWDSGWQFS